jgi:predicted ATPase/truncated hemoglobin YjbI
LAGIFVVEANLRTQMNGLRRVLAEGGAGDRYIATIPGRGYRFVAPVDQSTNADARVETELEFHNLPTRLTRLIGRDNAVPAVIRRLQRYRFVTIVGSGGIGKTAVALAVAGELAPSYKDGVHFVDLAPVDTPLLVANAVGSVLGVAIRSENPYPALAAFLRGKRSLLVIDNCEHVAEAAAKLAEDALKSSPEVHLLATSREPLRAQGETLHRLPPLQTASQFTELTAAEALSFPAIQLFVERAAAGAAGYELTDNDAPVVAQICRKLDGIALAIELAAGRVDAFGVAGIAARLNDRFRLLTKGRRTAMPRHQTLSAAFDWSYENLSKAEQAVWSRLGIFAGPFTLEAVRHVAGDGEISLATIEDIVANLVEKSLVVADIGSEVTCYRILDTGRAYALQKLNERGELQTLERRHTEYLRSLIERSEISKEMATPDTMFERYGGLQFVTRLVQNFYDRVLDSVRLAPFFANTDMQRLVEHQAKFISSVMGGPPSYANATLRAAHAHQHIDDQAFNEVIRLLRATLEDSEVAAAEVTAIIADLNARRPYIVAVRKPDRPTRRLRKL